MASVSDASSSDGNRTGGRQTDAGRTAASHTATDPIAIGRGQAARTSPQITATPYVQMASPATRYILRGDPQVMSAAGNALGLTISQTACRAATNSAAAATPAESALTRPGHALSALWLGPDEQLLLGPDGADIAAAVHAALRDLPHSLVEVSHRQIALQVSGPHATDLLNAGCPLDLDLRAFPVGMCTRTVLAKAEIVLWRTAENVFHIEVWRSFAPYVSGFLAEVARELVS